MRQIGGVVVEDEVGEEEGYETNRRSGGGGCRVRNSYMREGCALYIPCMCVSSWTGSCLKGWR